MLQTFAALLLTRRNELGKKLFTRHSFSIALTEEGVLLRGWAEDLVTIPWCDNMAAPQDAFRDSRGCRTA